MDHLLDDTTSYKFLNFRFRIAVSLTKAPSEVRMRLVHVNINAIPRYLFKFWILKSSNNFTSI